MNARVVLGKDVYGNAFAQACSCVKLIEIIKKQFFLEYIIATRNNCGAVVAFSLTHSIDYLEQCLAVGYVCSGSLFYDEQDARHRGILGVCAGVYCHHGVALLPLFEHSIDWLSEGERIVCIPSVVEVEGERCVDGEETKGQL